MKPDCFLSMIASKLVLLAYKYNLNVVSPIIAQAINETGWNESSLTDVYNYFGMKANDRWHGEYVTKNTWEQNPDGSRYSVTAKFRKYSSLNEGLEGYFEFIAISRYDPLRQSKSYVEYCDNLQKCGYATDLKYPEKLKTIIETYNLTKYDSILNLMKGR